MTETARAPLAPQHGHIRPPRARWSGLNSLEALERGFALFRSTFSREAWRYYAGAAPFVFAFIPMWVANGQIRLSTGALLLEAALLSGAYLLRAWMVCSYMQRVRERAFATPVPKQAGAIEHAATLGRLLAWKITLSAAALAALPTLTGLTWLYTATQFASIGAREDGSERHTIRGCVALASQWFGGGLLLFLMLFPLWIAILLNGLIVALLVPQLLHSILGVNTLLSTPMGIFALIRSSAFWLALFAGAWLALDPIVKCSFVVVHQHLRSRREGDDLRGLLASLPDEQKRKAEMIASPASGSNAAIGALIVLGVVLACISLPPIARAAQAPLTQSSAEALPNPARQMQAEKLRRALDVESQRAIYRWHDAEHPSPPTWFDKLLERIGTATGKAWSAIGNFLRKLWPRGLNPSPETKGRGAFRIKDLRIWLTLVALATIATGAVLFWLRRRRQAAPISIPLSIAPVPDLSESAIATERSEDEWFALASRLQQQGELRLAVRAAYLGLLAGLAQREWLTIRRDRTNREYLDEFMRRWRRRPQAALEARAEIPEQLRSGLRRFDGVWYGSQALTPELVAAYQRDQQELLSHV
ncbi:MAG TPA: hypothetical protein VN087_17015 [Verrucomicrobiae bacterium]|nr:hypothetical protein [Verrucomicrobiae bacterium]